MYSITWRFRTGKFRLNRLCSSRFKNDSQDNNLINKQFNSSSILTKTNFYNNYKKSTSSQAFKLTIYGSILAYSFFKLKNNITLNAKENDLINQDELAKKYGQYDKRFKTITFEELNKHNCKENRIYIAFQEGVYDITDFVDQHPGGEVILMAAGNRVDTFWQIYQNHITKQTLELLESYRVANIKKDTTINKSADLLIQDPFSNDPPRNPMLKIHTQKPFNAETPLNLIGKDFLTPNSVFFVRNHLPVPEINEKDYRLEIEGFGLKKKFEFTLDDLKKLPKHDVISTIQCAGNRREEFNKYEEVKGLRWETGAVSNAKWTGVYLTDLLKSIDCDLNNKDIKHIICEGYDYDPTSTPYSASIQAEYGLDPKNEVLIAYKMNDQDIPRDHGYPIRFIAPGIVGARNVKWLGKITLSNEEADSHWQRGDYKSFTPNTNFSNVDFKKGYSIQQLPVQSAICEPIDKAKISIKSIKNNQGKIKLSGYALSGGRTIIRVDVSKDDDFTETKHLNWNCAKLFSENEFKRKIELDLKMENNLITKEEYFNQYKQLSTDCINQDIYKSWSWVLWTAELKINENELKKGNKLRFVCKATDSQYNSQPEEPKSLWNFRGVLNNAWHKIEIELID